ncbi:MAG: phosphoglycerol transferase MdoB-like AlkP superfamily enzyme [Gammaproteobacteria bacterium]|jgi:phosphoglycerol transferase MdoB-like AlkP superfamily enzyme
MALHRQLRAVFENPSCLFDAHAFQVAKRVASVVLALTSCARLLLTFRLETSGWTHSPLAMLSSILVGLVNDLGLALILAACGYLVVTACARRGLRTLAHAALISGFTAVVFSSIAEIFFWDEFAARFNGIAVFYLIFPREVIGNLRESFPLELILPPIIMLSIALWWWTRTRLVAALHAPPVRFRLLGGCIASALAIASGVVLANALPANVFENREVNEIALNGPSNMVRAALTNDSKYDGVYPGIAEDKALPILRALVAQDNTTFLEPPDSRSIRRFVDNGTTPKRLNIVLVIEESFGSLYVDSLDSAQPKPITPELTRLSKEGLFFTNVYASGQRSVRGLEGILTSFTPIPGISTVRRPGSRGMHSLPHVLKQFGYQCAMLYGGRAAFDNMAPFWWGIGFDHVWDQNDITHQSFSTSWGVSDEDLFAEALDRIDERVNGEQPFLLTMFTVSNHRPYKFPQTHIEWDPALGNRANTARYADWAFGDFIEKARTRPWFDDTIFIFVADHGHKVNGAAQVPLHRYRIPLLIYSPKHVVAREISTLTAQIDLTPTLLGILGMSYESPFFGVDALRVPPDRGRIVVAHNFSVALARPGHAVVINPDGSIAGYQFEAGQESLAPQAPDRALSEQARALTQTAHRMFYSHEYHVTKNDLSKWAGRRIDWPAPQNQAKAATHQVDPSSDTTTTAG